MLRCKRILSAKKKMRQVKPLYRKPEKKSTGKCCVELIRTHQNPRSSPKMIWSEGKSIVYRKWVLRWLRVMFVLCNTKAQIEFVKQNWNKRKCCSKYFSWSNLVSSREFYSSIFNGFLQLRIIICRSIVRLRIQKINLMTDNDTHRSRCAYSTRNDSIVCNVSTTRRR